MVSKVCFTFPVSQIMKHDDDDDVKDLGRALLKKVKCSPDEQNGMNKIVREQIPRNETKCKKKQYYKSLSEKR